MEQGKAGQAAARWEELAVEAFTGFREWRVQHPRATFKGLETALDGRWARARGRILADAALQSAAGDRRAVPAGARPQCPACGGQLALAGQEERTLTTTYEQQIRLRRSASECTACGRRFFPHLPTGKSWDTLRFHFG